MAKMFENVFTHDHKCGIFTVRPLLLLSSVARSEVWIILFACDMLHNPGYAGTCTSMDVYVHHRFDSLE